MQLGEQFALASAFIWSVAVILLRVSGLAISALPLTFFKSVVATVFFALTLPFLSGSFGGALTPEEWLRLFLSAFLGIAVADTMVVAAITRLGASLHAIADCLYAPSMALVGYLLLNQTLNAWEYLGGLCVVLGVVVGMSLTKEVLDPRSLMIGVLLAGGAHVVMAVGILAVRDIYAQHSVVWVSGIRFFIASWILLFLGLARKDRATLWDGFTKTKVWRWSIPMSFLGPYLATMTWASGFVYAKAGRAAVFNQMSSVFVLVMAWLFLKEELTRRKLLGMSLAVIGSVIIGTH